MEPETFGRYRLLESIGRGGMAEVFLAKQEGIAGIERRLAIKRIHPQFTTDENFVKMFIDEARIVGHFSHQNIVQMLDFGKIGDTYYIAMEYVDGVSLAGIMGTCLKAGARIPPEAIIELAIQIGQGMDYAHNGTDENGQPLGIIHRDLTPHNILVSLAGTVKITDFGIAKASMNTHMTQAGMIKGKVPYMSPEQAMGQPLDRRSDLFSIGIILYEMCVLQRLFHGPSDFHVLQKVIAADIPDIRAANPDIHPDLVRVILKLLARNREDRYANAGEMANDLRHLKFSMGETFSTFNLGAYVHSVLADSKAPVEGPTKRLDDSKAPSAFEGLAQADSGGFGAMGGEEDDEVRTVLMQSPTEEGRRLGEEAPTRLIASGETSRAEIEEALAGVAGRAPRDPEETDVGEAPTMMDMPPSGAPSMDAGEAPTMMDVPRGDAGPRPGAVQMQAPRLSPDPNDDPGRTMVPGGVPRASGPGVATVKMTPPKAAYAADDAPTMMTPPRGPISSAPEDGDAETMMAGGDPEATMVPGMLPSSQRTRELLGPSSELPTRSQVPASASDGGQEEAREPGVELPPLPERPPASKAPLIAAGVVVLLLILFGVWRFVLSGPSGGALTVQVSQEGASIYLDGAKVSETSILTRDGLPAGQEIRVRVEKEGFVPQEEVVVLADGQSLALPITLNPQPPAEGYLRLRSEPPGARVLIGGRLTQYVTPARIPLSPNVGHALSLDLEGYEAAGTTVEVESGVDKDVTLTLQPLDGAPAGP